MNIVELIKLVLKHKILLFLIPISLASIVIVLTKNPQLSYETQAVVYTGITSGSSIDMEKKQSYFAANTAYDNLINIIKSRETREEVAVRLLTLHLMLEKPSSEYLTVQHFNDLKALVPEEIYDYLVKSGNPGKKDKPIFLPEYISEEDYEASVANLMEFKRSSNSNFIYELLNFKHPFYSINAVSGTSVTRVGSSDLIKLKYSTVDPGICKQTLDILIEVCSRKYKATKESGSDAVVKYFERQLAISEGKLKEAEDELLKYKQENKIINYYEQSKVVAQVREYMVRDFHEKEADLAGSQASISKLQSELEIHGEVEKMNEEILAIKDEMAQLKYQIVVTESISDGSEKSLSEIQSLKTKEQELEATIKSKTNKLYAILNSTDGIPMTRMMPQWLENMVKTEDLEAEVNLMSKQNKDFLKEVEKYAPFGANIKRIERKIAVIEAEYLEILHGLNLAKLKFQDTQIAGNLRTVDPAFFPLNPIPSKRAVLIVAAAMVGGIFTLGIILFMEYFDDTLKNMKKAEKILELAGLGMFPKILLNTRIRDINFVNTRTIEIITQNLLQIISAKDSNSKPKTILCFSTQRLEGKSVVSGNLAKTLKANGKKVLLLNYNSEQKKIIPKNKHSIINRVLGYEDPRIDFKNVMLSDAENYLEYNEYCTYDINDKFYKVTSYKDILESNDIEINFEPDFVVIELPAIIYTNYPADLFKKSDLDILICRSNRLWSASDKTALENLMPLTQGKLNFVLNGVEMKEIEATLGELPKKRSKLRKKLKSAFKFQFFNKNQI